MLRIFFVFETLLTRNAPINRVKKSLVKLLTKPKKLYPSKPANKAAMSKRANSSNEQPNRLKRKSVKALKRYEFNQIRNLRANIDGQN
jgi:hypothetical protein